jgi:hypothetical protein
VAERQTHLKHDPLQEYRSSVYRRSDKEKGPTRLQFPAAAFKRAAASAALDIPTVAKTKIDRLTWAVGEMVDMYGVPQLYMNVVRSADQARTPDVHTWAILPQWAARVHMRFAMPILSQTIVMRLMAAAGRIIGVGDGRQEKGKMSFGQFVIVNEDDERFQNIIKNGGMAAQDAALEDPMFYDSRTEQWYTWFTAEYEKRARNLRREKPASKESDLRDVALTAAEEMGRLPRGRKPAAAKGSTARGNGARK